MSLRRLKVSSNYGEDTFQWWRIHPRISIGGGIRYSRYIKSASCTSCSVVPWFFSTPGCTCVRQVSIHSDFCSVGPPPPAPFSIFRFRCLLDRRKKPCRALHVAFNFLFSTIRDVFGSGWKKGRKKKKKKVVPAVVARQFEKFRGRFEFASLSSPTLHPSTIRSTGKSAIPPSLSARSFSTIILRGSWATCEEKKKDEGMEKLHVHGRVVRALPLVRQRVAPTSYSASQGCGTTPSVTALLIRRIVYTSLNLIRRRVWWKPWKGGMRGIRGRHDVYCRLGQWLV